MNSGSNNPRGEELLRHNTEALVRHMDDRCVAVISFDGGNRAEVGSGTCITLGGRFFVATSAHAIENFDRTQIFVVHTRTPTSVERRISIIGHGLKADPLDIAFLEISGVDASLMDKIFVPLERIEPYRAHLPQDVAFIYGYPDEMIDRRRAQQGEFGLHPFGFLTPTIDPASQSFDQQTHIYLEYPKAGNKLMSGVCLDSLPSAHGMSGGGIWAANVNEPKTWSPDICKLIAIEHTRRENEWLKGTQIQHWLELIAEEITELRSLLAPFLQSHATPASPPDTVAGGDLPPRA